MKRLFLWIATILLPFVALAQNEALITENDSIPSLLERILISQNASEEKLSNLRHIKSNINLEFASSANAYFTENSFDEFSFKINRVRLEILGRLNEHHHIISVSHSTNTAIPTQSITCLLR